MKIKGFTLIEILVVATIIGLLAAVAAISYSQFTKQSRDARRKADLEQIRGALEMYKSNSTTNDYPGSLTINCANPVALTDGTYTYLSKIPNDPKCASSWTNYSYVYSTQSYTLTATLEDGTTYSLGPYGKL